MGETWNMVRLKLTFYIGLAVCTSLAAAEVMSWRTVVAAAAAGFTAGLAFFNQSVSRAKAKEIVEQRQLPTP